MKQIRQMVPLLGATLLILLTPTVARSNLDDDVRDALRRASSVILEERAGQRPGEPVVLRWNYPAYLGPHCVSQYVLLSEWLGAPVSAHHLHQLLAKIRREQLPDGSWQTIPDINQSTGNLVPAVYHYWILKAYGDETDIPALDRARTFILSHGGLAGLGALDEFVLALFGQTGWDGLPNIPPSLLVNEMSPFSPAMVAQWVTPFVYPLSYIRSQKVSKDLGPRFALTELWASAPPTIDTPDREEAPGSTTRRLARRVVDELDGYGLVGGYIPSSMLSVIVAQAHSRHDPEFSRIFTDSWSRLKRFADALLFASGTSALMGSVDDGHYWDTCLVIRALKAAGMSNSDLLDSTAYVARSQLASGGFPFGIGFERYPDTDDTAECLLAFMETGAPFESRMFDATTWLVDMQNTDGGWGAFAKDNTANPLVTLFAGRLAGAADLFDESSADVTGHILEALAARGLNRRTSETARRAIDYLDDKQAGSGEWEGRWGVNAIYATSAAIVGLVAAGVPVSSEMIRDAAKWLAAPERRNGDGGFGETTDSYGDRSLRGKGRSTPTQTAWALIGLIAAGRRSDPAAESAAQYLVASLPPAGMWHDAAPVGTGHPGIVYMQYPSYARAFPTLALAWYLRPPNLAGMSSSRRR